MSSVIIWIDTEEARLIQLTTKGTNKEILRRSGPRHAVETLGKNHPIQQTDEERFYHKVCTRLEKINSNEWFLMGSGPGPAHFQNHIEKHHPHLLRKIVGSQKKEDVSDAQLIDSGISFFRHAHAFQSLS